MLDAAVDQDFLDAANTLDREFRFHEQVEYALGEWRRAPGSPAVAGVYARALRRTRRIEEARRVLDNLDVRFNETSVAIQRLLIHEAEQCEAWTPFGRWSVATLEIAGQQSWILPKLAHMARRSGNRHLAAALYEADERSNWRGKYNGKNVLLSFPKSGTTWLRFAMAEYVRSAFGIPADQATIDVNAHLLAAGYPPDFAISHDCAAIASEAGDLIDDGRVFLERERVRYHGARTILLVRDPRDVVVSYYHQLQHRTARDFDFESLDAFVRHPAWGLRRVLAFYALVEPLCRSSDVLTIYYEDMIADPTGTLDRALDFFRYKDYGSPSDLDVALARSEFHAMQTLEKEGAIRGMRSFGDNTGNFLKVRKGLTGSYSREASSTAIRSALHSSRRRPSELLERYQLF